MDRSAVLAAHGSLTNATSYDSSAAMTTVTSGPDGYAHAAMDTLDEYHQEVEIWPNERVAEGSTGPAGKQLPVSQPMAQRSSGGGLWTHMSGWLRKSQTQLPHELPEYSEPAAAAGQADAVDSPPPIRPNSSGTDRLLLPPSTGRLPVHSEKTEYESSGDAEDATAEGSNGIQPPSAAGTKKVRKHGRNKAGEGDQDDQVCGRCSWRLVLWVLIPTLVVPMLVVAGLAIAKGTHDARHPTPAAAETGADPTTEVSIQFSVPAPPDAAGRAKLAQQVEATTVQALTTGPLGRFFSEAVAQNKTTPAAATTVASLPYNHRSRPGLPAAAEPKLEGNDTTTLPTVPVEVLPPAFIFPSPAPKQPRESPVVQRKAPIGYQLPRPNQSPALPSKGMYPRPKSQPPAASSEPPKAAPPPPEKKPARGILPVQEQGLGAWEVLVQGSEAWEVLGLDSETSLPVKGWLAWVRPGRGWRAEGKKGRDLRA
eukprot:gene12484-12618_t